MKPTIVLILFLSGAPAFADKPSIDRSQAKTADAVCRNPQLSNLELETAEVYAEIVLSAGKSIAQPELRAGYACRLNSLHPIWINPRTRTEFFELKPSVVEQYIRSENYQADYRFSKVSWLKA